MALDGVHLVGGVGLAGAVEQPHALSVGEELLDHGRLLVQGGQVGGAGDIAPHGARPVIQLQGGGVVGDRGAQDGDLPGGRGGRLEGIGGVGQDQVHPLGQKAVDDGAAVGVLAGGVLLPEAHSPLAQDVVERVLEALGGLDQRVVGRLLADAHHIALPVPAGGGVLRAGAGAGVALLLAAVRAGGQGQGHHQGQKQGQGTLPNFHSDFLQIL